MEASQIQKESKIFQLIILIRTFILKRTLEASRMDGKMLCIKARILKLMIITTVIIMTRLILSKMGRVMKDQKREVHLRVEEEQVRKKRIRMEQIS